MSVFGNTFDTDSHAALLSFDVGKIYLVNQMSKKNMQHFKRRQTFGSVFMLGYVALAFTAAPAAAQQQDLSDGKIFALTIGVNSTYDVATNTLIGGSQNSQPGVATADELFEQLKARNLKALNPSYNDNSASVARVGYRGLPMITSTRQNSPVIEFFVPSLNRRVVFDAKPTRDGNRSDLEAYLKSEGGGILNDIQKQLAKVSPIDPIAGNPNSLQSQAVTTDYDRSFTASATNIQAAPSSSTTSSTSGTAVGKPSGAGSSNLSSVGLNVGSTSQGGVRSTAISVPLSYTFRADIDPGRQITLYAPITVVDTAGAKTVAVNLGASYRYPITLDWALTPAIGYGVSGSPDLGAAAALFTTSLTSHYVMRMDGYDIAFGNSVGLYKTSKFSNSSYSSNPGITNTVYRNGILVSMPTNFMGTKMAYEISYINTLFTGTDLYSKQYNEIGLTIGNNKNANNARTYLRAGVSYLRGQNGIRGFKFNVGYWF